MYGKRLRGLISAAERGDRLERKLNEPVVPSPDEPTLAFAPPPGEPVGEPRTLTLGEWVTRQQTVPFTFRDVPLP